jgi:hypothetical protein
MIVSYDTIKVDKITHIRPLAKLAYAEEFEGEVSPP